MAYVGRSPRYGFLEGQTATFNGSTTVVTLQRSVSSTDAIDVFIDNVHQEPDVAYTLSSGGNSITFTGTPDNGAVLYIRFHGLAFDTARAYRLVNSDEGSSLTLGNDDTLTLSLDGTTALTATSSGITIPNLTVTGTTTSVNSTNLNIGDNTILLNSDVANDAAPTESAGITINRGSSADVDFIWNETNDEWYAADDLATGGIFRVKGGGTTPTLSGSTLAAFTRSAATNNASIAIIGNSGGYSSVHFGDENDEDVGQLNYSHTADTFALNKGLGVTGNITVSGTVDGVDIAALNTNALLKTGGTMTGALTINQPGNTPQLRISGNANWDFYSYNDTNFYVNNASGTVLGLLGNRNAYFSKNLSVGDSVLSTYHANYPAIDIGSSASVQGYTGNNGVWLQSNLFMNTNGQWTSKSDDYSAMIELYDGNINFYNTASGTGTRSLLTPMTIRQSGNVLIGKTTEGLGTSGNQFGSDGYVYHTRAGDVMWINRTASSSGTLLTFMENSATVGRIQSRSTDYLNVQIGSLGTGITGTSEHTILPSVNNARSNNTNDLGNSVYRWKDLFLAGDINMRTTTAGAISGGNNRTGSVIKLHHEAQWESGYGNNKAASTNDYLGGIEFSTGDSSTGEGVRAAIRATVDSYYNQNSLVFETANQGDTTLDERLRITDNGKIGINIADPDATLHVNGAAIIGSQNNYATTPIAGLHILDQTYSTWDSTLSKNQVALRVETHYTGSNTHARAVGDYGGGIGFNHLGGHSAQHDENLHCWIGPRVTSTAGHEKSALVFATNNVTTDEDSGIAERMAITPDGKVTVGTTNAYGDTTNEKPVVAGFFTTKYSITSIAQANTWTTVHTFANNAGNFMVSMRASGTGNTSHNSVGVAVIQANGATAFDYIRNGGNVQIRMSGLNLQVYQNVFAGANINWGVTNLGP